MPVGTSPENVTPTSSHLVAEPFVDPADEGNIFQGMAKRFRQNDDGPLAINVLDADGRKWKLVVPVVMAAAVIAALAKTAWSVYNNPME